MTPYIFRTIIITLVFCAAHSSWAQQYLLYAPQPAASVQKSPSQEGIIVQEIEVKKGDTLYGLSRKFSGHGMYFPQILLFNTIKNPNLIYPGNKLKVPVTQDDTIVKSTDSKPLGTPHKAKVPGDEKAPQKTVSAPAAEQPNIAPPVPAQNAELSLNELKAAGSAKSSKIAPKKKTAIQARKKTPPESASVTNLSAPLPASHTPQAPPNRASDAASGQKLFEAAVKAYRIEDCRTALELLDRYLVDNSGSPLAADANLYKAECYLKLSSQ